MAMNPYTSGILGAAGQPMQAGILGGMSPQSFQAYGPAAYAPPQSQPPPTGGGFFRSNPNTMTALALGLISGRNPAGGYNLGGVPAGQQADRAERDRQARVAALGQWIDSQQKAGKVIPPDTARLLGAYPELAEKYALSSLAPPNPKENLMAVDGKIFDAARNEWITPPGGAGGTFEGTALDAQDSNILLSGDPASPEYAMAYTRQYLTPKFVQGADDQGHTTATPIMPTIPAGVRPPTSLAAAGTVTPPAGPGQPIITGQTKPTDAQLSAGVYADRMVKSHDIITKLEAAGTSLKDAAASKVPIAGNYMISDEYRKLEQAERDFVNAVLRRESGAVISLAEFDNAKLQYFPQPGDDAATIEQKRANRETAIAGISRASGPNYKQPVVEPPASSDGWTDLGSGVKIRAKP